jgi:hypothetical protein
MERYVIVDADGYRANVVIWDRVSPWDFPDGFTAVLESECTAPERPAVIQDFEPGI